MQPTSLLQIVISLLLLAAFLAFVGYAVYIFFFVLPRQSWQKQQRQKQDKQKRAAELTQIVANFKNNGPSRTLDPSLTYEGWLSRVHYGRCLIDTSPNAYPFAQDQFPHDLAYSQNFPQSGPGEPAFSFYDITLFIRKEQGAAKFRFEDFIESQDLDLKRYPATNQAQVYKMYFSDVYRVLDEIQRLAQKQIESRQEGLQAFAVVFWQSHAPQIYTATDADLPPLPLKNILLWHILKNLNLDDALAVGFCTPNPSQSAAGEDCIIVRAERRGKPAVEAFVTFQRDAEQHLFAKPLLSERPAVFFASNRSENNPNVQALLNLGYL